MNRIIKNIILASAVLTYVNGAFTQDDPPADDIDLNVVIQGDAELFLNDANKVSKTPEIKESEVELPSLNYTLIPRKPEQSVELKPVPAAKITIDDPLPNLFRGYARGAVGTNVTGLGELRFMDGYSRKGTFDSHLKYFTSDGLVSAADSIADSFSELSLGVTGKRFLKKHSVGINVDYDREKVHYYGYDPDLFPENFNEDNKRLYRTFNAGVNLRSYFRDTTKVNYIGRFDFFQFSDNADGSENNFIFHADLNKFNNTEKYALGVDIDYNNLNITTAITESELNVNNTVINLNPSITTHRNGLMVRVGAQLVGDASGGLKPYVYPDIEARYSLFDGIFMPYAGLGGELHKNRYRTLSSENPFVQNFLVDNTINPDVMLNTNERINVYGGIRGNISNDMSFNASIGRATFRDFVYFVNDTLVTQGSRFRTEYGELKRTTITGELTYNAGEKIKFFGRGEFFVYDDLDEEEPWNQPNNRFSISGSYNIENKIIAELEVSAMGKRMAKSLAPIEGGTLGADSTFFSYELDPFIDVTLKAEYRYTKRLSVYMQINNMIAGKYQRFNAYPVQRFNLMGGATYSF